MRKFFIPPVFLMSSTLVIILSRFVFSELNVLPIQMSLIGCIIIGVGISIMGQSRKLFKIHSTTLKLKESSHLIQEGIYLKSRNPMYFGMFLVLCGLSISMQNLIGILCPIFFFLIINLYTIPKEEYLLSKAFGDDYLNYKKSVRRWF